MIRKIPYPPALRTGRQFEDPREMLRWTLNNLQRPSRRELRLVSIQPEDRLVLDAAMALLRSSCASAEAILAISRRPILETTYPILRSILETWAEFNLLLSPGDPAERAAQMKIWAAFAIADSHNPIPAHVRKLLDRFRRALPEQTRRVEERRGKNKTGHWTGAGRKRLIGEHCGDQYATLYGFLSWDAHPIVQVLLDIAIVPDSDGQRCVFVHRTPQDAMLANVLPTATHIVIASWNDFAERFSRFT